MLHTLSDLQAVLLGCFVEIPLETFVNVAMRSFLLNNSKIEQLQTVSLFKKYNEK